MKVLIIGATGFIGKYIYQGLKDTDYEIVSGVRNPEMFDGLSIKIDFIGLQHDKGLVKKLEGFDVVINSVGIIAEKNNQTFEQIHTLSPIALFNACKEAQVQKIIHISALGSQNGTTPYHTSKNKADMHLRSLEVDYAILHPSIVYGDDGKSTALFQALASLPFIPIIGDGSQLLQPIAIEDLIQTVKISILSKEKNIELDLVGEDPITYEGLLQGFRRRLGYKPSKAIAIPTFGTDIIGKILDEPTVNHDNIIMLNEGNTADVKPLSKFLGYMPKGIEKNLFQKDAYNAQKLYASLYLVRPLLRMVIGFVWIWSGIVSAFLYPQKEALTLLHDIGISAPLDLPLLYVASFLDITLGILTIIGYKLKHLLNFQILVIVVYTLLLTLLAPFHWLHPFGPVLKNIPLVISIYILMKMEDFR
jgi:uncharacterized protein YbjT (DUF2867 family)/uncharacterized membrane protein YphA (DoxX/SURF4 family)